MSRDSDNQYHKLHTSTNRNGDAVLVDTLEVTDAGTAHLLSSEAIHWKAKYALYASYGLATWGWRTWEFSVALILIYLHSDSLLFVAAYGLLDSFCKVVAGSAVGSYLDRCSRITGAGTMYFAQNFCIATSAAVSLSLVWSKHTLNPMVRGVLVVLALSFGALSSVGSLGISVAVERDWVKALAGSDLQALTHLNAGMRRIDLSCLLLAPMVAGSLMTYAGMPLAVGLILAWNLAAWLPETSLLRFAQSHSPALRQPRTEHFSDQETAGMTVQERLKLSVEAWQVYVRQPVLGAALALAMLYCTVLSLGFLMTSYLKWRGISEAHIAIFRGAGALTGLASTVVFPPLQQRIGLEASGLVGICWQLASLGAGVLPMLLLDLGVLGPASNRAVLYVLLAGLAASRFGLWLFDLAVTTMLQDRIEPSRIGAVNGVQGSLQSAFEVASFVAGLIVHRPQNFHWLAVGSLACVMAALLVYVVHMLRQRQSRHSQGWRHIGIDSVVQLELTRASSMDSHDSFHERVPLVQQQPPPSKTDTAVHVIAHSQGQDG